MFAASSVNDATVSVVSACKESLTLDLWPWLPDEPGEGAHTTRHRKVSISSPDEKVQRAVAFADEMFNTDNLISRAICRCIVWRNTLQEVREENRH